MKYLPLAVSSAILFVSAALAQPTTGPNTSGTIPDATSNAAPSGAGTDTGTVAAAGDRNQAVATTDANSVRPAKGANSFSSGEARHRIAHRGFTKVSGLHKENGVW